MTYISVSIDIDDALEQISDEDIRAEYEERNLGPTSSAEDEIIELQKAYIAHHNGEKDKAYAVLWEMCLNKLNKVV